MTAWYEIRIPVYPEIEDAITNFVFDLGCRGCEQTNDEVVAYFENPVSAEELYRKIAAYFLELNDLGFERPSGKIQVSNVPEQDWNAEWKKSLRPIQVSDHFVVKPTWVDYKKPADAFVIEMDPKQAFGTGSHATTQIMLLLLEKYFPQNATVLDVGTGTGILALAASMLGAKKVTGVDIDPVAVETARENVHRNIGADKVSLLVGDLSSINLDPRHFNLILANINKSVILNMMSLFKQILTHDGYLIVSGILLDEINELKARILNDAFFKTVGEMVKEEWIGLVLCHTK